MHASIFDSYQLKNSTIHKLDPKVKVVLAFLFILSNAILPDGAWLAFAFTWSIIILICWLAKINLDYLLKRSLIAIPFAVAAITVVFNIPGDTIQTMIIGPWSLEITNNGVIKFVSIMLRSWLSVQFAILLITTTQFPDLIHALRHLKVPAIIISVISFMYRYIFVLSDEAIRLLRARESRSARVPGQKGGGEIRWRAKIAGNIVGQLFLRSYERSDRVYNAMVSRGFTGELLTMNPHKMANDDWNALLIGLTFVLCTQFIAYISI